MTTAQQVAKANFDLLSLDEQEEVLKEMKKSFQDKKADVPATPEQIKRISDAIMGVNR